MDARNRVARLKARQEAANQTVTVKFQNIGKLFDEEMKVPPQSNPTLDYLESLFGKLEESPEHDTHYRLRRLHGRLQDSRMYSSTYTESRATTIPRLSTDFDRPYSHLLSSNLIEDRNQESALVYPMMPPQPVLHIVEPEKSKNEKTEPTPTPPPSSTDLDVLSIPLLV